MIRVAQYLTERALATTLEDETNLFGRSAFNRFYYATFLTVRETLVTIDPSWAEPTHKQVPEILRGALVKRIKNQLNKGLLEPRETEQVKSLAMKYASDLANTLQTAYLIRIQADYKPEQRATRKGGSIHLYGLKTGDAAGWHQDAVRFSTALLNIAKKVGLT